MKKAITFILLIIPMMMCANEVSSNQKTGMKLVEEAGIYLLKSKTGVVPIGDLKAARDFMFTANLCFTKEMMSDEITVGETKFAVRKDDTGMYIVKIGLGAVKLRPGDACLFLPVLEGLIIKQKGEKIWKIVKE